MKSQEEHFDQRVMSAMNNVIQKLEKEEAITKVTSQLLSEDSFDRLGNDSITSLGSFPLKASLEDENTSSEKSFASFQGGNFKLNIELPNPKRNDSTTFIMRETQKRVINSQFSPIIGKGDSIMKNQLKRKATLINEIVNELAFIRISNNFNERIDSSKIDSLCKLELLYQGISTPFVYDILDAESGRLSFNDQSSAAEAIKKSQYSLQLFPNDYFIKSDSLLLYFPQQGQFIWLSSWKILIVSILIVLLLSFIFYSSLSTIFKQKQLSQVKNDFINNMTHELKTPISTIALACEALSDQSFELEKDRRSQYVGMINNENTRLSLLVDNVLKSAVWDSSEMKVQLKKVALHPLIEKVVDSFQIQIENKGGSVSLELNATNDLAFVDEIHFTNIIFNLLDNANKYSADDCKIKVLSKNTADGIVISVSDDGLGISKEDQKKIFDKFYRVHTGNIHEVKGFGLGLSYVKRMMDHFNGEIIIESKKGTGTTISLVFEQNQ